MTFTTIGVRKEFEKMRLDDFSMDFFSLQGKMLKIWVPIPLTGDFIF
jgi:hypothetical protein